MYRNLHSDILRKIEDGPTESYERESSKRLGPKVQCSSGLVFVSGVRESLVKFRG